MDVKVGEPELSADGDRVHVEIIVEGHPFQAVFVRRPDGTISAAAMHVAGLEELPRAKKLEEAFGEAARHFRRDREGLLHSMLRPRDSG
jgi:hypothetical protein